MARRLQLGLFVTERRSRGFTLIELMIVVVIVGVLATLAVLGYRKLVQSSHVSEATGMVQNIRVAQEGYHSETQQYANVSQSLTAYYPNASPSYGIMTAWGKACSVCNAVTWSALPIHIDGPVLFGYATVAGIAGSTPSPASVTVNGNSVTFPTTSPSDWYIIAARGDLDGNTSQDTFVYGTSWTNQLFVDHEGF